MKKVIVLALGFVTFSYFGRLTAQESSAVPNGMKPEITDDLKGAAKEAKIELNDQLVKAFTDSASSQSKYAVMVYRTVPKNERISRLARYLSAKSGIETEHPANSLTKIDLNDFHWAYVASDIQYSPMRLDSRQAVKLRTVESSGHRFIFDPKTGNIKPDGVILLPKVAGSSGSDVTATFDLENHRALWSGSLIEGQLKLASSQTSRGCEIYVNSDPNKANVYFNGNKWNRTTNIAVVEPPGTWEVTIRLAGRKEWRDKRTLGPGDSWTINAVLAEQ